MKIPLTKDKLKKRYKKKNRKFCQILRQKE